VLVRVRPGAPQEIVDYISRLQLRFFIDPASNLASLVEITRLSTPQRSKSLGNFWARVLTARLCVCDVVNQ
jgi:hypothetical protein